MKNNKRNNWENIKVVASNNFPHLLIRMNEGRNHKNSLFVTKSFLNTKMKTEKKSSANQISGKLETKIFQSWKMLSCSEFLSISQTQEKASDDCFCSYLNQKNCVNVGRKSFDDTRIESLLSQQKREKLLKNILVWGTHNIS